MPNECSCSAPGTVLWYEIPFCSRCALLHVWTKPAEDYKHYASQTATIASLRVWLGGQAARPLSPPVDPASLAVSA